MVRASLPPGFRFHPTDDELVTYYLKRKVTGKRLRSEAISEVEIYKFAPWDLPGKACLQSDDLEWFFFCALDRKYASGQRAKRSTDIGYWKTTGKDRDVYHNSRIVGMKKTLVFHIGRAPRGERTNWVMHEYRLEDQTLADAGVMQDAFVLCKIFEKSGPGPKNGEQRGAPFREEDWEDDDAEANSSLLLPLIGPSSPTSGSANTTAIDCRYNAPTQSGDSLQLLPQSHPVVVEEDPSIQECVNVHELLKALSDNDDAALVSNENCCGEGLESAIPAKDNAEEKGVPFNNDEIFSDLGDIVDHTELLLSTNFRGEDVSNPMHLDGYYLELDDLRFPEGEIYGSLAPLKAANISSHMEDDSNQAATHDLDASTVQIVSEVANDFTPQTLSAGERHEFPLPSKHISNGGMLYSELRHLLASIPAKPASAAEIPCLIGGNQFKGHYPYCQSPFHVDTELAVANICSVDVRADDGKVEHATCMVYHGGKPSRKCGEHSSCGGGFMFVFLLVVMSAFVWIILLALSAKLGRYAWKHMLAW